MKLTTRTRYGMRLLFNLAVNYEKGYIQLNDIAKKEAISEKYLEQIVSYLKSAGFVLSQRGAQGGYILSGRPSDIRLNDVVAKLEGTRSIIDCLEDKDCARSDGCPSQIIWKKLNDAIDNTLKNLSLADMVDLYKRNCVETIYEI
jgi:Rrf2 family transcriptional regulator, cysteine metabolism repressor